MTVRRMLYRSASLLGWWNAAQRGPDAVAKRAVRVTVYRAASRAASKASRWLT